MNCYLCSKERADTGQNSKAYSDFKHFDEVYEKTILLSLMAFHEKTGATIYLCNTCIQSTLKSISRESFDVLGGVLWQQTG